MKGTGHGSPSCGRGDTPGGPPRTPRHPHRPRGPPDRRRLPAHLARAPALAARARRMLRRRRLHGPRLRPRLRSPQAGHQGRRHHRRPRPPGRLRPARRRGRPAPARAGPGPRRGHQCDRGPRGRPRGSSPGRPLRRPRRLRHPARRRRRPARPHPRRPGRDRPAGPRPRLRHPLPVGDGRGLGADGRYRRPFLQLDRQTARKACMVQSLPVWDDPHNTDPAYTRSRLRHEGLPALEKALGKGVVEALARTAQLSRDDADALDTWASQAEASYGTPQASWSAPSSTPCRPPCAAACCAGPPSRPAPRPVRCSPVTSRKSTA